MSSDRHAGHEGHYAESYIFMVIHHPRPEHREDSTNGGQR